MSQNNSLPDELRHTIDSLENLLRSARSEKEKLPLYAKTCWTYLTASDLTAAKKYADSLHVLSKQLNDTANLMRADYYYGVIARLAGQFRVALPYLQRYIDYYQAKGDSSRVAGALFQAGSVQSNLGNYDKALANYYRLLAIEQKEGNDYSVGYTLNTIAIVLKETGKRADAENIYRKALYIFDTLDEKRDKTDVLVNLGNLYTEMGRLDSARWYYDEALRIDQQTGKQTGVALSLANIAFLFDKKERYDSALVYHLRGLAIREKLPSQEDLARSLIGVGLGYKRLKQLAQAKRYLSRARELAESLGSKPMQKDVYQHLAEIHAAEGDFTRAYSFHVLYTSISDSLLGEQTARQLNELQTRYETAEKDNQIALLASEKEISEKEAAQLSTTRKALIAGLFATAALALLIIYIFRQRYRNQRLVQKKNEVVKEAQLRQQLSELEMKALRAQVNPHFMFNCMNSINRLILQGENEKASAYLAKFSKLVRQILENAGKSFVPLEQELSLLESYIELETLRFKERINYQILVADEVDVEDISIPSMLLQPFVENAIWHGLMHKPNGETGKILIDIRGDNGQLLCSVADNGIGREKARQLQEQSVLKKTSMGVQITEERLRLWGQQKGHSSIKITDLKDAAGLAAGTRVEIQIPIV